MKTFIFGASGFAKEVEWMIYELNKSSEKKINVQHFVVADTEYQQAQKVNNIEVISESMYFDQYHDSEMHNCILAVGSPQIRKKIFDKIKGEKTLFPNLIHPTVLYDERFIRFEQGAIICAGVILTTNISIQDFVHINLDSTVGHDSKIGSFTTISPGVHISGNVAIEANTFMGTAATILENIAIVEHVIIGAGTVVTKSIAESGTYVGIPAKKIK